MPIERVGLLSRARYVVDFAVHELHTQLLSAVFTEFRKGRLWPRLFLTFPSLQGEKAFLREVDAFRAIIPPEAQTCLDAEIAKIKAAYAVAYRLKKSSLSARTGNR
jgi:hypothetical protein